MRGSMHRFQYTPSVSTQQETLFREGVILRFSERIVRIHVECTFENSKIWSQNSFTVGNNAPVGLESHHWNFSRFCSETSETLWIRWSFNVDTYTTDLMHHLSCRFKFLRDPKHLQHKLTVTLFPEVNTKNLVPDSW